KMASIKATGRRFEREKKSFEDIPITSNPILIKFSNMESYVSNKIILNWKDSNIKIEDKQLVESINLKIQTGEKIGIIGNNGVGKSTLLYKIWQELKKREDIVAG